MNAEGQVYTRMYESMYPKDDRDDALLFPSKAIGMPEIKFVH